MKTYKLNGPALDWAVAKARNDLYPVGDVRLLDGNLCRIQPGGWEQSDCWGQYSPSTDWAQGGPIIELEAVCTEAGHDGVWLAYSKQNYADEKQHMHSGPTALIAAMRCFVDSKLGDSVDVPEWI